MDLGNLIKTIVEFPKDSKVPLLHIPLKEDFRRFAPRHLMLLLLARGSEASPKQVADLAVQLWYSTFLSCRHAEFLQEQLYPFVKDMEMTPSEILADMVGHSSSACDVKTDVTNWRFGTCSVTAHLTWAQRRWLNSLMAGMTDTEEDTASRSFPASSSNSHGKPKGPNLTSGIEASCCFRLSGGSPANATIMKACCCPSISRATANG